MKRLGQGKGAGAPRQRGRRSGSARTGVARRPVPQRDASGRRPRREVRARARYAEWQAAQPGLEPFWFTRELQRIVRDHCRRHGLSDNAVAEITGLSQPTVAKALRGRGEGVCHTLDRIIIRLRIDPEVIAKLLRVRARALKRAKG